MKLNSKFNNIRLNDIFTSPWALWAISISLAVIMWVYVTGMDEAEKITRKFSCPLEYRGLDAQSILRGVLSEVDIEIRGSEEDMMRLDYNFIRAYVDARNLIPGKKYTVDINVEYPPNITLVSCFPSQTTLDIVRQVIRLMPVETALPQNIPEGRYVEGVEIIPKEVGIRGAEDDVAKVGSVRITPTVDELQKGEELLMPVKFAQSEPFEGTVTIEPAQVRFRGNLVRGLPRKRVPVNARLAGRLDSDYEVKSIVVDPSDVQIEGKAEDLAKVEAVDTEMIEVSVMNTDSVIIAPLKLPDVPGVTIPNATSVRVTIQLSEARAEKMIANIPVELRGAERHQNWACNPSSVAVTIEGRPSVISKFDAARAGLRAYVDMTNIFMTPVTLPVMAEVTSGDSLRVIRTDPQNVTVNMINPE
ncbi:MAG: hypothetical protein IJQ74_06570 [Synergistaceae bacterium]|nr:hypothetical protein [Synergistaceae bacterium]